MSSLTQQRIKLLISFFYPLSSSLTTAVASVCQGHSRPVWLFPILYSVKSSSFSFTRLINFVGFNSLEEYLNVTLGGAECLFSSFDVGTTFHQFLSMFEIMWGVCWWSNFHSIFKGIIKSKTDKLFLHCIIVQSLMKDVGIFHLHYWVVNSAPISSDINFWIQFMKKKCFWFYTKTAIMSGSNQKCN